MPFLVTWKCEIVGLLIDLFKYFSFNLNYTTLEKWWFIHQMTLFQHKIAHIDSLNHFNYTRWCTRTQSTANRNASPKKREKKNQSESISKPENYADEWKTLRHVQHQLNNFTTLFFFFVVILSSRFNLYIDMHGILMSSNWYKCNHSWKTLIHGWIWCWKYNNHIRWICKKIKTTIENDCLSMRNWTETVKLTRDDIIL